jgi:hypothetical protein
MSDRYPQDWEDAPDIDYDRIWRMIEQDPRFIEQAIRQKLEEEFAPELLKKYGYIYRESRKKPLE